jgi:Ca2+-binding EF-hand superfamily protein
MAALDANQDGALSADEIAKAPAALLTLDRNQDGQLTSDELRQPHPVPPVFAALDANHDGVIDAAEMDNAPAVLKTLDANNDGRLTLDELLPPPPVHLPADGPGTPHSLRPPRHDATAPVAPQQRHTR